MQNIVRLSPQLILELSVVMSEADMKGKSVRVMTDTDKHGNTFLCYDAGAGWTPPLYGLGW